jgi:hypothetical protein
VRIPWDELSISSSGEEDDYDTGDVTEMGQLAVYISNTINCLLRISMVIQKPAPHDRFIKSGRFDQSFRQPWDEQHIRDKFANVPEWLVGRLGKAIARRRQFLEYRKVHQERIASQEVSNVPEDTGTVVSSLPTVAKQDQGLHVSMIPEAVEPDNQSEAGVSETSYTETIAGNDTLLVPKMPEDAEGGAMFECPYCFMIIGGIHSRLQWKYVLGLLQDDHKSTKSLTSIPGDMSSLTFSLTSAFIQNVCLLMRHLHAGTTGLCTTTTFTRRSGSVISVAARTLFRRTTCGTTFQRDTDSTTTLTPIF